MEISEEEFNQLLDNYVEGKDVMITNARGFLGNYSKDEMFNYECRNTPSSKT